MRLETSSLKRVDHVETRRAHTHGPDSGLIGEKRGGWRTQTAPPPLGAPRIIIIIIIKNGVIPQRGCCNICASTEVTRRPAGSTGTPADWTPVEALKAKDGSPEVSPLRFGEVEIE